MLTSRLNMVSLERKSKENLFWSMLQKFMKFNNLHVYQYDIHKHSTRNYIMETSLVWVVRFMECKLKN